MGLEQLAELALQPRHHRGVRGVDPHQVGTRQPLGHRLTLRGLARGWVLQGMVQVPHLPAPFGRDTLDLRGAGRRRHIHRDPQQGARLCHAAEPAP